MKKNIIFFGGAGFLGNYFCQKLVSLGNKVTVIDLKFPKIRIKKVKYVKGDMCNQKFISKFIKKVATFLILQEMQVLRVLMNFLLTHKS